MSSFEVSVCRLHIEEHPNADRLALGIVGGYRFVIGKEGHEEGELGAYIPEGSILPDSLIEEMGVRDYLAGKEKNRVKATRLRGELSQGLWYPFFQWEAAREDGFQPDWAEGANVAELLGVTKYEPPIPLQLQGKVKAVGPERPFWWAYDLENVKSPKCEGILRIGEPVQYTEKLHGTLLFLLVDSAAGEVIVTSKGLASRRLAIEEDEGNTYWRAVRQHDLVRKMTDYLTDRGQGRAILFGEVIGVQDLTYGLDKGKGHIEFRAFDLLTEYGGFLPPLKFDAFCTTYDIPRVPILYTGDYTHESLVEHTNGQSVLAKHIREGLVIRPLVERTDTRIGRVALKSVSGAYLTRKGEVTEFN